jgi:carbonic anhydrase
MQQLIDGYARFRSSVFPQQSALFEKLAAGQQPQALFICCSDSRIVPEVVMQCEPGTLFPSRSVGNLVPPPTETSSGVAATIEYAIRVLRIPDVIVCGHSDCGAMKGILESENIESLPAVRSYLEHAGPSSRWLTRLLKDSNSFSFEQRLKLLTEANVIAQLHNLRNHPAVHDALNNNTVRIHGWLYEIGTGAIQQFDVEQGRFRPLLAEEQSVVETASDCERRIA